MTMMPNVRVVLARCARDKSVFGVRVEETSPGQWFATWAFATRESVGKNEGYDRASIAGAFGFDPSYPGCPCCHSKVLVQCACGKVSCWQGETDVVTCAWCGVKGKVEGVAQQVSVGIDR